MARRTLRPGVPYATAAQRQRQLDLARDSFIHAAAALTQWWDADNLAFALLEGGRAMLAIAQADGDRRAYDRVQAALAAVAKAGPG